MFAAYACLAYHPGVVHCFEPAPYTLDLLRQNAVRFPPVTVHPFALGRADGEGELHLDAVNGGANSLRPALVRTPAGRVRVRDAGAVWDELGLGEVDVLAALGRRLSRVRVVMAEYHVPDDRRRIDALLPGHLLFGATVHSLAVGVVKYVRADLVG